MEGIYWNYSSGMKLSRSKLIHQRTCPRSLWVLFKDLALFLNEDILLSGTPIQQHMQDGVLLRMRIIYPR